MGQQPSRRHGRRVDPDTMAVTSVFPVGSGPQGIVVSDGAVWVANSLDLTVSA